MQWVLFVFIGACSYGILPPLAKLAYAEGFTISEINGSQLLFAGIVMWLMAAIFGRGQRVTLKQALMLISVGSTIGLTGILYYLSLEYLPASVAIVIMFQFTWMGLLIESIRERKRPSREKMLAILLLIVGTVLAAGLADVGIGKYNDTGLFLGFLSAVTYTLYMLLSGKVATEVKIWKRSAFIVTGSMLFVLCIYPPVFVVDGSLGEGLLFWALLLAIFGTAIPAVFLNMGIPRVSVGVASITCAAELPSAVLFSSLLVGEQVTLLQWLGVGIILIGIAVPEWLARQKNISDTSYHTGA